MIKRSLIVSIVVGTLLTLINQGDILLVRDWEPSFVWKLPLTYTVPFLVANIAVLLNSRG